MRDRLTCGEDKQKQPVMQQPSLYTVSPKKLHHFHVLPLFCMIWWVLSRTFTILPLVSIPEMKVMVTLLYVPLYVLRSNVKLVLN